MRSFTHVYDSLGLVAFVLATACGATDEDGDGGEHSVAVEVSPTVVGKLIYFDTDLSEPAGQSCGSCHSPDTGFAEPHDELPVSRGANPSLVGGRNAPSASYAAFSPPFHFDEVEGLYVGGQFWDGRAIDLAAQAKGPFLNPLEMGNADEAAVIEKIAASEYAELFEIAYGEGIFDEPLLAYDRMAEAIAAYEASDEVNRFTSKYDHYLRGQATLTEQERRGLRLYEAEDKGNCAACHPSQAGEDGSPPLLTDFTYDNLGVPANPDNPFYRLPPSYNPDGAAFVDLGLGAIVEDPAQNGKFKVPTLRNIALTGPYMHNGVFATLEDVVRFYNTRDTGEWDPPEVADNVNTDELGDLGLTEEEVADIVAFMLTLTDGWAPPV
jgi:cytochrome c peroxidase